MKEHQEYLRSDASRAWLWGAMVLCQKGTDDENNPAAHHLKYLYDFRVVRSSEISQCALIKSDRRELDDRFLRILLSSSRKSHRLLRIHCDAAQDNSGSDYADRIRCFFRAVLEAASALEPRRRIRIDCGGGRGDLQAVVRARAGDPQTPTTEPVAS